MDGRLRNPDYRVGMRLVAVLACMLALSLVLATSAQAAGSVSVKVNGSGDLIVRDDGTNNCVEVSPFDAGEGSVQGCDSTLVNGRPSASFSGANRDFRFKLRGGDDTVFLNDGDGNEVPNDLKIKTGRGNDTIRIRSFLIRDDLSIDAGSGNDALSLEQTAGAADFVLDKTGINTGSGKDEVLFETVSPQIGLEPFLTFGDDFRLKTGSGRDFVHICRAVFADKVRVDLGNGDDKPDPRAPADVKGGLCVCDSTFEDADVLDDVEFRGGNGEDEFTYNNITGIAPPGLIDDFFDFELQADDCTYLGGEEECVIESGGD
jgi:hypothetical protein